MINNTLTKVSYGGDKKHDIDIALKKPEKDTPLVPLDVDNDVQHLKWLSKEEFMSGMVGSPVLAESLRRMTSADTEAKPAKEASLTLKVDMGMGDESFSGFVSVGKKVLFEVWDAKGITSEFLGEVYINDLEECREMYEGSFPLQAGTLESTKREKQIYKGYHLDPTTKVYKPPEAKDSRSSVSEWQAGTGGSKANLKEDNVQGELSISARWIFPEPVADNHPMNTPRPEGGQEREKYDEEVEKARNTGRLNLSIRRATGLKSRDAGVLSSRGETASRLSRFGSLT